MQDSFAKFNIDTLGVCDAEDYNKACGTDYTSCIVALFPYFDGIAENSNISIYAHGKDYHIVIRDILSAVAEDMGLTDYKIHSDMGPEIEKALAIKAGLCFLGRNGMCINEKYGSYFFIGYIVCRDKFEYSKPLESSCANCMRCVASCPSGALDSGFCKEKCLSEITQKRGELTDEEIRLVSEHNTIFGCDICQLVCPHNQYAEHTPIAEFKENKITHISFCDIENLSERKFKKKYGDRAFAWRGVGVLRRNLGYAKIKEQNDEDCNS